MSFKHPKKIQEELDDLEKQKQELESKIFQLKNEKASGTLFLQKGNYYCGENYWIAVRDVKESETVGKYYCTSARALHVVLKKEVTRISLETSRRAPITGLEKTNAEDFTDALAKAVEKLGLNTMLKHSDVLIEEICDAVRDKVLGF